MFRKFIRTHRIISVLVVYAAVAAAAFGIAVLRSRAMQVSQDSRPQFVPPATSKPHFSLSSHRTFGTGESARIWIDYQNVDHLDFRVYQVNDPARFFAQLDDPHQMGKRDQDQVAALGRKPSLLERVRKFKRWALLGIKTYVRSQLRHESRKSFNHKFRPAEATQRTPLNTADYARVPLLNPNQLVTSWREPLTPLENFYDRRMIPLGKCERGVYLVEAVSADLRAYTIVVVTDLTMVEKTTPNGELLVFAVDRRTGEPRPNTAIEVVKGKKTLATGTTDKDGILRTQVTSAASASADPATDDIENTGYIVLAKHQDNFAISDLNPYYFGQGAHEERLHGYIYTDRPVYRPLQKVYFKGIVRAVDEHSSYQPVQRLSVNVSVQDPNNSEIFSNELLLSPRGTFSGELEISEAAPLGMYRVVAEADGHSVAGEFYVAEYKKPEYKVKVSTPARFVPAGETTRFTIGAQYFFGAPVAQADVKYYVYRSRFYPWQLRLTQADETDEEDDEQFEYYGYGNDLMMEDDGKLDAHGQLSVDFQAPAAIEPDPTDYTYRLVAQVTDSSRRTIEGSASFVATRGSVIARAFPERYVYSKGDVARINISTANYEGQPAKAKVTLKFLSRTWTLVEKWQDGYSYREYQPNERLLFSAEVETNAEGSASYQYQVSEAGNIQIKAIVTSESTEHAFAGGYLWVMDRAREWLDSSHFSEDFRSIKLFPDKKFYRPGDTARILAILPSENARLLITTELTSVMSARILPAPSKSMIIEVPIDAKYAPDVFLNVTYVKDGDMYTQSQRLSVPATDKLLNLEIISNKTEYKPRETASYTVLARNADGSPVSGAEVSLGVVDEAVYSVMPEVAGNIRKAFYGRRYNSVDTHLAISYGFIGYAGEKPFELARQKPAYQLADFKNEGDFAEPIVRKQFKDTAFWKASAITAADGRATVKFQLPDNLTTWRATARAVTADTRVGVATYKVVARKDLLIRLETPRFLTQGDTVTLSGIVHNYLKTPKSTQISLEVDGATLLNQPRQTVTLGKDGEHRVDWQVSAFQTGQIRLLAKALTNTESDAVELTLNVVPRGLHRSQNRVWASSDETLEQTFVLKLDPNANAQARKLRIEASPSVAATLFGALDYLTTYPYGCTEQTMSSFLPNVIVAQALREVKTTSVQAGSDLETKVRQGRDRLYAFQHDDGGWGWWKDDLTDPFMTAYVVYGLTLAKNAGQDIDQTRIDRGRQKLSAILVNGKSDYGTQLDLEIRALMIFALASSGSVDNSHVEQLFVARGKLQPYGRALLALTLKLRNDAARAQTVATEIERSAAVDSGYVHWESKLDGLLHFRNEAVETTALSVKALAQIKPRSSLLFNGARWLVANRKHSYYWNSTRDTAFAILGLIDYVKASDELRPNYQLEVFLNGETVLSERITSPAKPLVITRKATEVADSNEVKIVKRGRGNIYFSGSVDYYTDDEEVSAQGSTQLSLQREYFRLRVMEDGYRLKWALEPLAGEIHSGDLIVARLTLTGEKARHLMIEDPIPAGAEQIVNLGSLNLDYRDRGWSSWYSAREFRDQRTVFFLDYFSGKTTLQYALRVQVPGQFVTAPARAELMYQPEVEANTATQKFAFQERK